MNFDTPQPEKLRWLSSPEPGASLHSADVPFRAPMFPARYKTPIYSLWV